MKPAGVVEMVSLSEGIIIEYLFHLIYVPIGYAILRLSRTGRPGAKLLPERKNLRIFVLLSLMFSVIELAVSLPGTGGTSIEAAYGGPIPLIAQLFFEGVVVGWTEEFLFRGCLQRALNKRFSSLIASRLRTGTVMTSAIFGLFHFANLGLGESFYGAIPQVLFATFFALIVGSFYDRTSDLAGAAWIHNITDIAGTVLPFVL